MTLESSLGRNRLRCDLSDAFECQPSVPRPLLQASYEGQAAVLPGPGEGPSGPTGTQCGLPGQLLEQPRSLQVSARACEESMSALVGAPVPHVLLVTVVLSSLAVHFRYVVFHPFLDEILIGKIKGCSPEGVHGN